jgi:hypothetical protein
MTRTFGKKVLKPNTEAAIWIWTEGLWDATEAVAKVGRHGTWSKIFEWDTTIWYKIYFHYVPIIKAVQMGGA